MAPMINSRMRRLTLVTMLVAKDPHRLCPSFNRPKVEFTEMFSFGIWFLIG
jgi:hypothetical protein